MTEWVGSEKQIAWAKQIKAKMVAEAEAWLAEGRTSAERAVAAGLKSREECDARLSEAEAAVAEIRDGTNAAYFINNRMFSGQAAAQALMRKARQQAS